jgi:hypothetical protein
MNDMPEHENDGSCLGNVILILFAGLACVLVTIVISALFSRIEFLGYK